MNQFEDSLWGKINFLRQAKPSLYQSVRALMVKAIFTETPIVACHLSRISIAENRMYLMVTGQETNQQPSPDALFFYLWRINYKC